MSRIYPAVHPEEEDLQVVIKVISAKHNCHVAFKLTDHEIDNGYIPQIIRDLKYRIEDFIQEKLNDPSEVSKCLKN